MKTGVCSLDTAWCGLETAGKQVGGRRNQPRNSWKQEFSAGNSKKQLVGRKKQGYATNAGTGVERILNGNWTNS
jgi:hypothetical protein